MFTWQIPFTELVGKTFEQVLVTDDEIYFINKERIDYKLYHDRECCEAVYIESIDGDIQKHLPQHEVLEARESYNRSNEPPENMNAGDIDSYTWSFYTIRTMRDTFTIRFFGSSNGNYSETAQLVRNEDDMEVPT